MDQTTIHVPNELFAPAESSSYAGAYELESLNAGPDVYTFDKPLSWNVLLSNTGGALLASGTVSGWATTQCARCLEEARVEIQGVVEAYFLLEEDEGGHPGDEDEEVEFDHLGPDNTIDLAPLLESAIIVDLPLMPLCKQDCAGICPDCGANLNHESCDCALKRQAANEEFEQAKNPFSVLKNIDFG